MTSASKQSITNSVTGERITFLEKAPAGEGYEKIEVFLPPGASGPPLHYHEKFEEMFEVVSGKLFIERDGEKIELSPDSGRISIPVNTFHMFKNASGERPVTFRVTLTPAHYFQESMCILYGLLEDGLYTEEGQLSNPLHTAVVLDMQNTIVEGMEILEEWKKEAEEKGVREELMAAYVKN
ncbi:cupin domain-containing protein [Alkalicoccus luteus]|uniref:Cupin domain-containing protein n=1 Tax=Alkalicoccus luteus TaxID=1237094 RepID=A0A969PZT0_9BACI|nr:cupin domain-containing protein [Alkalicoccus luteus]NJP38552.1 cupin domain-containing protein [Alkalicoccus luteus]